MYRLIRIFFSGLLLVVGLVSLMTLELPASSDAIHGVRIVSSINPVVAGFLRQEISRANEAGAAAFLLELDTPGGLDTAMREIIKQMLGSKIPVIVYVYPPGARAASAGALMTLAADFAVMAPGTNLGAATPVSIGSGSGGQQTMDETMKAKVVNDAVAYARSIARQKGRNQEWAEQIIRESISTPANEALELKVIDLIAENEQALLDALDGRSYLRNGESLTLKTAGKSLKFSEMNWRQKILNTISNPNVAYMLLMLGILGIFFEISQPGVILPGAVGALALLLAFIGLQMLPVNYVGVLLIVLAVVLFILEIKIISYGMLTIGGIIALTIGSMILIDGSEPYQQISLAVIIATVSVFSGFFAIALYFIVRTQQRPAVSGLAAMVGERGEAATDIKGEGRVFVHSEYWTAVSNEPIRQGDEIEVVGMLDRMKLEVRKVSSEPESKEE
ncbi:MAG: serine protease [Desulfuromonas sp.]|nr:MAG: serine protease [Desulfuromonas sp.]